MGFAWRSDAVGPADATNLNLETNQSNNVDATALYIEDEKPDLVVANLTVTPSEVLPGETVTFNYQIVNTSDLTVPNAAIERYYLSRDAGLDPGDRAFANSQYHGQSLPPKGQLSVTQQVIVPTWVIPGAYELLVLADADHRIGESSETNNVAAAGLSVSGRADLIIRDLSVTPSRGKRGQALTLRYQDRQPGRYRGLDFRHRALLPVLGYRSG